MVRQLGHPVGRRDKNIAKIEICGVFRDFIVSRKSKITVSAVIEATGMNRKTFYNHFADLNVMVAWCFRHDMLQALKKRFEPGQLLDPPVDPYLFEGVPFYTRAPSRALSLDQSEYFRAFYDMLNVNQQYYRILLRTDFAPPLRRYLVQVYEGLFYQDVEHFLSGRKMPEDAKRLIARFYAEAVVHNMLDSFLSDGPRDPDRAPSYGPIDNLAHENMLHIVEAYQDEKSKLYFRSRQGL